MRTKILSHLSPEYNLSLKKKWSKVPPPHRRLSRLGLVLAALIGLLCSGRAAQASPVVVATIPVGGHPAAIALNAATGRFYVGLDPANSVAVVDTATNSVVGTIATAGFQNLSLAANPVTNRIYIGQQFAGRVSVVDGATDTTIANVPIGTTLFGVGVNPNTNRVYVVRSNLGDIITMDGASPFTLSSTITLGGGANNLSSIGMATDTAANRVYVTDAQGNQLVIIDGATNSVVTTVPVGNRPQGVAVNVSTQRIYVTNLNDDTVSVVDATTNTVIATIPVGTDPFGVAVNETTNRIYVANNSGNNVSIIDGNTDAVAATIAVGQQPSGVAVNPNTGLVYIANNTDGTVSVVEDITDTTPPVITIASPADGAAFGLNEMAAADYNCTDADSGVAACSGPVPSGSNIDTGSVGAQVFTVNAADNAGNTASLNHTYNVIHNFSGFFPPVDNPPALNRVKAGSAVPVKFSLSGDQGLNIFAAGYPKSQQISCDANAPISDVEETVTAGSSSLTYDANTDQYIYTWKTDKSWAGTCRQLIVQLNDTTAHLANFDFK
ncbi:MAG: YncE family protein [Anaerolineaceae bacterium]|nr:YncE family protein [Anaerolineaceae bacterium]